MIGRVDVKPKRPGTQSLLDNLIESHKSTAANKEDIGRIDLNILLIRMLPPSLRRDVANRPFEDLQQGLLHAFARNIPGNRNVFRRAPNLVDLVDVNNPALGPLNVVVGGLQQSQHHVLNVLSHVARFGQGRRIGDRKGHIQNPRQGSREQSFAGASRTGEQDIALLHLHLGELRRKRDRFPW